MSTFNSIVTATDLTEGSEAAARVAASIARDHGALLCVMHVYILPTSVYGVYPTLTRLEPSSVLEEAAEEALRRWVARVLPGVDVDLVTRGGSITEMVFDEMALREADLLVIGTHVQRGLPHALLGGIAEKLVRACPVPVLTVRPETPLHARATAERDRVDQARR